MNPSNLKIGVLELQGAFHKHRLMLHALGAQSVGIRYPEQLDQVQGLIIPGGESTTMSRIIDDMGMRAALNRFDKPIYGTCAGAVLLAERCDDSRVTTLKKFPVEARRNAYGRQVESFIESIKLSFNTHPFQAIFIRAPKFRDFGEEVEKLASFNGEVVMARRERILISAFHPELTHDFRIHQYFITQMVNS